MAKGFAGVDVGKMDFNGRQAGSSNGVAQGVAGVGVSAWIDQNPIGPGAGVVNGVYEYAFVVGLLAAEVGLARGGQGNQRRVNVCQRFVAIDFWLARAEQIQVGAM